LVPRHKREFWERLEKDVRLQRPPKQGKRWSEDEIERIIRAAPETDTYQSLAKELGRSDGAVRRMKVWVGHILRGEYADKWGAWIASDDPRVRANKHDVILVHKVLKEKGFLDLPVTEQFQLARPLPQPHGGWRGDRTGEALRRRKKRLQDLRARITGMRQEASSD